MNSPAAAHASRRLRSTHALWVKAIILTSFLAASTVPSPLYAVYRAMWGFSPFVLTLIFASYAIAMLAALLVFGALSDYRGRREVIIASLLLEVAAMVLFWRADSVAWLLAARVLQGIATGIASSALAAGLVDLNRDRGALMNSVAPMVGLGLGGLGASVLVQFAPEPTRLVFDILLTVFAVLLVVALYLPETVQGRVGAWKSLVPTISVPHSARSTMLRVLPVNTAQWAIGGFYLSLGPTLARTITGNNAPLIGGVMISAMSLTSAVAVALARRLPPRLAITAGALGLAVGVLFTLTGLHWRVSSLALAGTIVAGAGFGAAFSGSIRSLVPLALAHERAGLMAGFYVASYLAFSVPAIAAGLLSVHFGLEPTAVGYGIAMALLSLSALWPSRPSLVTATGAVGLLPSTSSSRMEILK